METLYDILDTLLGYVKDKEKDSALLEVLDKVAEEWDVEDLLEEVIAREDEFMENVIKHWLKTNDMLDDEDEMDE